MKQPQRFTARMRALAGALALVTVILGAPLSAMAASPSEGAKILNVVTVEYQGTAVGGPTYTANAAATVTVTLLPAALSVSGPDGTGAASCPPSPVNSGETSTVMNAVSANANGDDTYALALDNIVGTDVANESVTFTLYDSTGAVITGPTASANIVLGSAITLGVKDGTTDTLLFPGGVDINAMFAVGDIVVVKTGSPVAYKVVSATNGNAASHTHDGGSAYTDAGTGTAETLGELVLEAFEVTIGAATYGTNATPAFADSTPGPESPAAGTVIGEMVLVEVSVTADATSQSADGTVAFDFTTEDSDANTTTDSCSVTFNQNAALSIEKLVRNVTASGAFAATATGQPGDVLEYQVTVVNPDASNAESVIVTDAVPEYTTLVVSGGIFATASLNSGAAIAITAVATDDESATVASGNAAGTAAGSAIIFYLGAGNADTTNTGGTLAQNDDVVLLYQVTID